jgi:hypothetical protein
MKPRAHMMTVTMRFCSGANDKTILNIRVITNGKSVNSKKSRKLYSVNIHLTLARKDWRES